MTATAQVAAQITAARSILRYENHAAVISGPAGVTVQFGGKLSGTCALYATAPDAAEAVMAGRQTGKGRRAIPFD